MRGEGVPLDVVEEVCQIIAHHHTPGVVDTLNFKVVYDADIIEGMASGELEKSSFLTEGGEEVARLNGFSQRPSVTMLISRSSGAVQPP